jgi:hypothetical protein
MGDLPIGGAGQFSFASRCGPVSYVREGGGEPPGSDRGDDMSKRDELIGKYIDDVRTKVGESESEIDVDLLRKVTIACGPSIYNRDSETVSSSSEGEMATVKNNFLIKKLGLSDGPSLEEGLNAVVEKYGTSNTHKYRAVMYYLLTKHFGKQSVFK